MKKLRHKIVPSVYLVLIKDGKVLLGIRSNTGYEDGKYALVSGHAEEGESLIAAMIREAKEEANIDLLPKDMSVAHVMHRRQDDERIDFFFVVHSWRGEIVNNEPKKCLGWEWLAFDALPENIVPYVRKALFNIRDGVLYDEFGW